ncbi:MAG: YlxM family DNA-binding protein [Oscillospiraceae bacterium]|jgi:predicted DNA-binding protein YlxM (UPF0122 family)|nr:YlxM family DNA-binding protein [Oscillospiraceae bacterium]MCI1991014.1 YlxM family DNA-binding protein [Oscillospiraceae bacterium]MCI2035590.1 YlxM family DNA-binding protein [Oscillospiraceae bacterium]
MAKDMKISFLLDFYGDMLTEKQREVIELYYNDDLSLSEIAENEGISRQGVRDAIKRAESQLLEMESRLGFAGRFREVRAGLERIREAAGRIKDYNSRGNYASEIDENAKRILETARRLCEE